MKNWSVVAEGSWRYGTGNYGTPQKQWIYAWRHLVKTGQLTLPAGVTPGFASCCQI